MSKPTIPEVFPKIQEYFRKTGELAGGPFFHVILEDANSEQCFADSALQDAQKAGNAEAIEIARLLAAMSSTQRKKLASMPWRPDA